MPTLPDLNTSNIGFIGFWNAIKDGGVSHITPSEATSDSNVQSSTSYDNGWEGTYRLANGRTANVRVKYDGWIVLHIDRSNTFQTGTGSAPRGYWDIIHNWAKGGGPTDTIVNNEFERAIHSLQSNFSNSGNISYNSNQVNLYNYEYTNADYATVFSSGDSYYGKYSHPATFSSGIVYTPGTNLHFMSAQASTGTDGGVHFGGTGLAGSNNYGSIDALGSLIVSQPATEYLMTNSAYTNYNINGTELFYQYATGSILTLWS